MWAKRIGKQNAKSFIEFEKHQDTYLDKYKESLDREKSLNDREIKNKSNLARRVGLAITEKSESREA